jgi:hypothetical protein
VKFYILGIVVVLVIGCVIGGYNLIKRGHEGIEFKVLFTAAIFWPLSVPYIAGIIFALYRKGKNK